MKIVEKINQLESGEDDNNVSIKYLGNRLTGLSWVKYLI